MIFEDVIKGSGITIPGTIEDKIIRGASRVYGRPMAYIIQKRDFPANEYEVYMIIRDEKYRNKYFEAYVLVCRVQRYVYIKESEILSEPHTLEYWGEQGYDI